MANFDPKVLIDGIERYKYRHPSKIVEADGATILEPGIRKICSKYRVDVTDVSFTLDKMAIHVGLRRNVGEPWKVEFDIPRSLIEDDNFTEIERLIDHHAALLDSDNYEERRNEEILRDAVSKAIKELV